MSDAAFLFQCPRCGQSVRGLVTIMADVDGDELRASRLKTVAEDHLAPCPTGDRFAPTGARRE